LKAQWRKRLRIVDVPSKESDLPRESP